MFQSCEVESSAINAAYYDAENEELCLEFVSGNEYTYLDVDADLFNSFITSESQGRFYNQVIKDKCESIPGKGSTASAEERAVAYDAVSKLKDSIEALENARKEAVDAIRATKLRASKYGIYDPLFEMEDFVDTNLVKVEDMLAKVSD